MVNSLGAELQSLILKKRGREYLWQGDKRYWARHAPILFPIVGKLRDGKYHHHGKTYSLPQHGFARDLPFKAIQHTENQLVFQLLDNEHTRAMYPFSFALHTTFTLEDAALTVAWQVENRGDDDMFYSIGGHPAFNIPLAADAKPEECRIAIDGEEICQYGFRDGLLDPTPRLAQLNFSLADAHFIDGDTLIYHTPHPTSVTLSDPHQRHAVRLTYQNLPFLGIWPPVGTAPFVCLEPWAGVVDRFDHDGELAKKFAIQRLSPAGSQQFSYQIEFS